MVQSWGELYNYIEEWEKKNKEKFPTPFWHCFVFKVLNISANGDIMKTSFVFGKS